MSNLSVGPNAQYQTIGDAVKASKSGDTVLVAAGTYTNDFVHVDHSLNLQAVGGVVTMQATVQPTDGKAILTEGGAGLAVTVDGFAFTGAAVSAGNGAGIRYEGGSLTITNSHFYGNENGILGASDPNGVVSISHSEFDHNGVGGYGQTHNIYINQISLFSLTDSFSHDANVGHEIKSRAANNTITNNRIFDNSSTSSYEVDLPNGGNAAISGNIIEQGVNSGNPYIIAYGEEGNLNPGTSLTVAGNTFINDEGRGPALWNATGSTTADFSNNAVYNFGNRALVSGPGNESGTTVLAVPPALDQSAPYTVSVAPQAAPAPVAVPAPAPAPVADPVQASAPAPAPTLEPVAAPAPAPSPVPPPASPGLLVLHLSEDMFGGDAQFIASLDGTPLGAPQPVTASHASGQTQDFAFTGDFGAGPHDLAVSFLNDAWLGTPATDRNLYVDSVDFAGTHYDAATAALYSAGTWHNQIAGAQA